MEKVVVLTPINIIEKPNKAIAGVTEIAQPDLLYMDSILVSTGENKNDDVFLPIEMWKARNTPRLKPIDWEHETGAEVSDEEFSKNPRRPVEGNQIIGVMYNTYIIDDKNNIIPEDKVSANENAPSSFHIVDQGAIYKNLFPRTAAKIEKGAKEGLLFVSMEAWFDNYDYLVGNKVVARNEQTAFLDKQLRARGGNGLFGQVPVKRVLRNITFGGKGIVFRPANSNSVIKSVTDAPVQAYANEVYKEKAIASNIICEINPEGKIVDKELVMGDKNETVIGFSVEDYKAALAQAAELKQSLKAKEQELAEMAKKIEAAEKKAAEDLNAAKAKAEETNKKLLEVEAKLAQVSKDKLVAERRVKIAAELKADGDKLEKLLTVSKDMSDEVFASFISSTKEILVSTQAAHDDMKKKEEEEKKKKAECEVAAKAKEEQKKLDDAKASESNEGITDPKILEKIKASAPPSPGVDNSNSGVDLKSAYASLASMILTAGKKE